MTSGRRAEAAPEPTGRPILAIDTSTEWAGVAIVGSARPAARSWDAGRTQTTAVLPEIERLLARAEASVDDLAAVAVATGPGTFTGLRVGLSIAKGLVLARDMPLIGIPTLELAASAEVPEQVAVLPAGRGRVVWQRFTGDGAEEPRNSTVPELVEALAAWPDALVIGELAEAHRPTIEAAHPRVCWEHRDPLRLATLARRRLEAGDTDDPVTLEPIYLHGVTVQAPPVQDRLRRR